MVILATGSGKQRALDGRLGGSLQPLCRVLPHELHTLLRCGLQPMVITVRRQDHYHPLFIIGLVKLAHQVMPDGVDGQHRETVNNAFGRLPRRLKSGNAHGFAVDA